MGQTGKSGPSARPRGAASAVETDRAGAVRSARQTAGTSAFAGAARRRRPDRRTDRYFRIRFHQQHPAGDQPMTSLDTSVSSAAELAPAASTEPWRRRLVRTLLYGKNVDRGIKAKARVGLAI